MSLLPPSQLLLQQELSDNTLLINPPMDDLAQEIPSSWHIANFSSAVTERFKQQGFTLEDICKTPEKKFSHIIIYLPKAKARLQYLLDYACACLEADGDIWFIGENKGGIKSLAKQLKNNFEVSDKMTSGKHSAIVSVSRPLSEKTFDINNYYVEHKNELGLSLKALPGVFSQDKLDKGTAVLLKNLPRKVKGRVLDFGCGAGIIGAYVSQNREFEELELIDDDVLAVRSAQKNIEDNKMELTECYLSDGFSKVEEECFHWIISNPPFHQGVRTNYNVTEAFLTKAKDHLKLSGKLVIVANEFLNYEVILREHFNGVTQIAKENGFKVIQCEGIRRKRV